MNTIDVLKKIAFRHTNWFKPKYPYNTEPIQLATLVYEMERLRDIPGAIIEIGVARGLTTRFLCEHMVKSKIADTAYYALDTFQSFIKEDVEFEVEHRNKKRSELQGNFGYNDFNTWKNNFSEFPFVKAIQADCSTFDYASIAPFKLVFLDVDLYIPVQKALPKIYELLSPGGIILVDDVQNLSIYDGAYQSYMEFCAQENIAPNVVGNKCGIIRKHRATDQSLLAPAVNDYALNADKPTAFLNPAITERSKATQATITA
jgi:SAM-dependent methyltransferase